MRIIKALKLNNDVVAVLESPLPNVSTVSAAILQWVSDHWDDYRVRKAEVNRVNINCQPLLTGDNPEFVAIVSGDKGVLEFETTNIPML